MRPRMRAEERERGLRIRIPLSSRGESSGYVSVLVILADDYEPITVHTV